MIAGKRQLLVMGILLVTVLFLGFVPGDDYFRITSQDVVLKIPEGFPVPVYDFGRNPLTKDGFILGRKLFYEPLLSKDQSTSCGSCHQRIAAFAHIDHALSHGIYGKIGSRNVPALQNLIWKDGFMWDGGVNHLELQAIVPMTSPIEMDESLAGNIAKLRADSTYRSLFRNAFEDTVINSERMLKAITQFVGLMISANSRYDKYRNGLDSLNAQELRGLNLFRANCSNCHREPLFTDNSYRNNGLTPDTALKDIGRSKITGNPQDRNKFKVPSLRNVAMTYPYMHDGRYRKLEDVLAHYAALSDTAKKAEPRLARIGPLSVADRKDIIAFLLTLTDKEFLYDRRFADPSFRF